ncbi:GNAT family N-acetyltransferase [soil metagenome]
MAIEIRSPSEDELRAAMQAGETAFGEEQKDEDFERHSRMMSTERFYAAYDCDVPVGTTASFSFTLTVPGGELPAGGVTWVGVLPSHRRRGVLTQMMRRQLDDLRELGDPLAILWASEAAIYGRFGYEIAAPTMMMDADRSRFAYRDDPGPSGAVRIVDREEAARLLPQVYDAYRRAVPGAVARSADWWQQYRLADPEHWRSGAGPKFNAVLEFDGRPVAYVLYRIKNDWDGGYSKSEVKLVETCATSPAAERELWRFVFGIDLIARVQGRHDPGSPLFLMLVDPRSLQLRVSEGLWLRFVDLGAALDGRTYATDDSVVLEVRDEFCPWNAGRWRVGEKVERTCDEADLELDTADLASAYLGAFDFNRLAAAERVRELRPGALDRATELFRTSRPPHCLEDF